MGKNTEGKSEKGSEFSPQFTPGPPTLVYKTKDDYRHLVPVVLNETRDSVLAYPHPADLGPNGSAALPTELSKGYLLDNRGINIGLAYIDMTLDDYAKLKEPLSPETIKELIVDTDPLLELCNCGNRNALEDPIPQLNALIESGGLRQKCLPIK
jgi:hypothetical protein